MKTERQKLADELSEANRESSTWTILFHQTVADRAGLNITDHKALDILSRQGAMTAGELSKITGLTTGAVTGVINRLEKAGYVRRENDPRDRRRVIIRPIPETIRRELGPLFGHFQQRLFPLIDEYTDEELRLLLRYYRETADLIQQEIAWLRNIKINNS